MGCSTNDEETRPPQLGVKAEDEQGAEKLGFPSTATRNTVRVGGSDAVSDAAGVAGALYPATGDSDRPTAVVLVDKDDWATAVAASVLVGRPIGAPILLSDGGELPAVTKDVLDRLKPKGSDLSKDAQVIRVGPNVARPDGYKTALIEGDNPFERAAATDRFFSAARAKPSNDVVLYSADDAEFAMPAAAWAARSGDAALPVRRDSIPPPIVKALGEHSKPNVFVLGPEKVISEKVVTQLKKRKLAREREPHRGAEPGRERDRVRTLREGRLRLGRGRARLQLRPGEHDAAQPTPRRPPRSRRAACSRRSCSPTTRRGCRRSWRSTS